MPLASKGWIEISCTVEIITDKAIRVNDGSDSVWIPRSQIEDPDPSEMEVGSEVTILIPEWLAESKGLI